MTTPTLEAVSEAKLREMLAGLEGVTPGPWVPASNYSIHREGDMYATDGYAEVLDGYCIEAPEFDEHVTGRAAVSIPEDAAHIARCDPDTMRSILTELLALRANGVEVKAAIKPLEWKHESWGRSNQPEVWRGYGALGLFAEVAEFALGDDRRSRWLVIGSPVEHFTLKEAKAAAQADYERSVPQSPSPASGQEPVEAMSGEIGMLFDGLRRGASPDNSLRLDRLEWILAHLPAASGQEPSWFAVQSISGVHVGMWQDEKIARRVFNEEYPDGQLIPLHAHLPASKPAQGEGVNHWRPIETAPRDGTDILVFYDHEADPYQSPEEPGKLTDYAAWAEGGDFMNRTGYCIAAWKPSFWESTDEYGSGYWLPAYWFARQNDDYEVVVNPTHWMPLPPPPALTAGDKSNG